MRKIFVLFFLVFSTVNVIAQTMEMQQGSLGALEELLKQPKPPVPTVSFPLERAVDPETYVLGPGDVLRIVVDARSDISNQVTVNPEGSVFVPSVGEIPVSGMLLSDAKKKISDILMSRYVATTVSVFLVQLRAFRVTVAGAVHSPGLVTVSAMSRVSEAIDLAGGFKLGESQPVMMQQPMMMQEGQTAMVQQPNPVEETEEKNKEKENKRGKIATRRKIQLIRQDGSKKRVDLVRYFLAADLESNPILRDGDVIFVPYEQVEVGRVEINGAVKKPSDFEFVEGETIGDLIELAHGLAIDADSSQIELVRFDEDNKTAVRTVFSLSEKILQAKLKPDDRIYVRSKPKFHHKVNVKIEGEVLFPGWYALENEKRTLTDLVERAGGFTEFASIKNALVFRTSLDEVVDPEFERLKSMRTTEMTDIEREYIKFKLRERSAVVAVDFDELFHKGNKSQDILLKNGDKVVVPTKELTVKVTGQVVRPGLFTYIPGQTLEYYVNKSGGYSWNARKSHIRVIRAHTGEWLKGKEDTPIFVGDNIFVPEKPERNWWEIGRDIITVAVQLATIYIVIDRYGN